MTNVASLIDGLLNFRDFGGCPAAGGRRVRGDCLFRSGQLSNLAPGTLQLLLELQFEVIVDLRDRSERQATPPPWPPDYALRIVAHEGDPLGRAPHLALLSEATLDPHAVARFYEALYNGLPFDDSYRALFARAIRRLADASGRVLIQCAAGKDRTGVLSALILSCLGVPRELVMADYLRSSKAAGMAAMKAKVAEWARERYARELTAETIDALLGVRPEYLEAALGRIEREHGSIAAYLQSSGVSERVIEELRARFLEA